SRRMGASSSRTAGRKSARARHRVRPSPARDRLAKNPRWSPVYASASSASNSSYYFSHVTREAARIVFLHGLWPAALAIWARSGQAPSRAPKSENARWSDGSLTVEGMVEDLEPLPLARLAQEAHARGFVV